MTLRLLLAGLMLWTLASGAPARADTTADCGRFYLKWDEQAGQMKCVGGKVERKVTGQALRTLARDVARTIQSVQRVLTGAEAILRTRQLSQEVEQRTRALITESQQRTRELQRISDQLIQAIQSRTQELASQQRQTVQAQVQLAQELEQKQRSLSQALFADQRARTQELTR